MGREIGVVSRVHEFLKAVRETIRPFAVRGETEHFMPRHVGEPYALSVICPAADKAFAPPEHFRRESFFSREFVPEDQG